MKKPKRCTNCDAELWGPDEAGGVCLACQGEADTEPPAEAERVAEEEADEVADWERILP